MGKEIETQVLGIDKEEVAGKLRELGAKEEPEVLQKRWVFDINPCTAKSTGTWIRLRQAGDQSPTICYKNKLLRAEARSIPAEKLVISSASLRAGIHLQS